MTSKLYSPRLLASLIAALVGPALALLASLAKLDSLDRNLGTSALSEFVYGLVLFVWPFQPLGVLEGVIGWIGAAVITVSANILLFMVIGWLGFRFRHQPATLAILWGAVVAPLVVVAWWASGYDAHFVNIPSLAVAALFYGALIWVVSRDRMMPWSK